MEGRFHSTLWSEVFGASQKSNVHWTVWYRLYETVKHTSGVTGQTSGKFILYYRISPNLRIFGRSPKNDNKFICSILDKYKDVTYRAGVSVPHDDRTNWLRLTIGPDLHKQKFMKEIINA